MKTNKEILEMFIDNFKEFENKYKALTRYVETLQDKKEQLEKENQELKDKLELLEKTYNVMETVLEQRNKTIFNQQDQFLKVVESVLNETTFGDNIISKISGDTLSKEVIKTLLQEIKSEMLKGSE